MQECILILSMHRSGSSCMTGCMNICGFSLGKHASHIKNKFNLKGYFENERILSFNESVLSDIGSSWKSLCPLTEQQIQKSLRYKTTLARIIEQEFEGSDMFAIKDPRMAILQRLYIEVLSESGIKIRMLRLRRGIDAVCRSLRRAQHIGQEHCVQLDSMYQSYIDSMVGRAPYFEVEFSSLVDDPAVTVEGICDFIGISFSKREEIIDFVDRGMVNF